MLADLVRAARDGTAADAGRRDTLAAELRALDPEAAGTCDFSRLPVLDELDPEGSYLSWTIELRTVQDENAVRAVFEFVEWDCELDVAQGRCGARAR